MASPSFSLPWNLNLSVVTERLASQGFSVVMRSTHGWVPVTGMEGSFLVVTTEELGILTELSQQVEAARRGAAQGEPISGSSQQEGDRTVQSARQRWTILVGELREQFQSRVLSVVRRSELIQEDYCNAGHVSPPPSSPTPSPIRTNQSITDRPIPSEDEEWEVLQELTAEELAAIGTGEPQRRTCSIQ